jgi:phosphatidylinositol alpha-1,6-mannosyltransferase
MKRGKIYTFLATETYISVGGMQMFNRRLIRALSARAKSEPHAQLSVALRTDEAHHIPQGQSARIFASGKSKPRFVFDALRACFGADVIVVGLINLLPIAFFCKIVAPKAKVVLIVHGDDVWGDPTYRAIRWYDRFFLRRLDRIISVSDYTSRRMQQAFGLNSELFRIFLNAVDPISFQAPAQRHPAQILSVTRLAAHDHGKNIDKVLRAVARLIADVPQLHYTIVGDGVLRPQLETLSRELGIQDHVTFAGRVNDAALSEAYSRASVFVMPSQKEGFGIVFLEAWQRELPVICGIHDAACEIISDQVDGFAVDPHDIDALAARISYLIAHPDVARSMGQAGADKVRANYLDAAYQRRLGEILDEVEK